MNSVDQRFDPSLKSKNKLNLMKTGGKNNTDILIALPRCCIFMNCRFVAILCRTSLLAPFAHFLSVCHSLENPTVFRALSLLLYFYNNLSSVIIGYSCDYFGGAMNCAHVRWQTW